MPQISKSQLVILFINIVIPTAHVQVLLTSIKYSRRDAWLAVLIGYIITVGLTFVCLELIKRYPDDNILDLSVKILGKPLGKLINIILLGYSFLISTYMLEQFATLMTTMVYRGAPDYFFLVGLLVLAVYAVNSGIEVVFRVSDLIFIAVVLVTVIIGVGLIKFLDFELVRPIFTEDSKSLIKGSLAPVAFLGQIIIFLFFHDLVDDLSGIAKAMQISLLGGMLLVLGFVIADLAVFGPDLGSILLFPPYMLIRYINIEEVLDRMEILMLTIWTALSFLEITTYFWISSQIIVKFFNISPSKKQIINIPLAIILVAVVTLSWEGIVDFQDYAQGVYTLLLVVIQFSIPSLLYIVGLIRS